MYRYSTIVGILFCCSILSFETATAQNSRAERSAFSDFLHSGEIAKIIIIHLPSYIETRTRVNPEALRQLSSVEVSFENPQRSGLIVSLLESAKELDSAKSASEHQVRWGILFFDASNKERFSVFIDPTGRFVQLGVERYEVKGRLLNWIQTSTVTMLK